MNNATIKDIAKDACVSIATVSRVLNKKHCVSPKLIEKVLNSVNNLNYYPNSIARSLKTTITYTIGLVVSDISNNFFTEMAVQIERVIFQRKYSLIMCTTEFKKGEEKKYLEMLYSKKIDGLILNTMAENDDIICQISTKIPVVLVNRKIFKNNFHGDFVGTDCKNGAYLLTEHLLKYGHRKIGIINGPLNISTARERYEGFKSAMKKNMHIHIGNDYIYKYNGDFSTVSGYNGISKLMNLQNPPTAVVVMNNNMLLGALKYCKSNKIEIPENLSICSFGNINNMDLFYAQPTIVEEDPKLIGTKVAKYILERIEKNKNMLNRNFVYKPKLLIGDTVDYAKKCNSPH
ncbi:MAG: LacI family DNA-binding transcriptional regulator [Eubacteriaceae bacterium]